MSVRRTKIIRDLLANKSRSLLIILAIAIGVAAFGLMITGRIVLEENLRDGYAGTSPAHSLLSVSSFDDDLLKFVRSMDGVSAAQAERVDQARILSTADTWLSFEMHSLPDSSLVNMLTLEENAVHPPPLNGIVIERSV
jgi:putative ABC transport system permease protein